MVSKIHRFDIWLVQLNPTEGKEINKIRPCVVVSPDVLLPLATVIMAPMTTKGFFFPSRVKCVFKDKTGLILLDQLRAVDKTRLIKKQGTLDTKTSMAVCRILQEMFAY